MAYLTPDEERIVQELKKMGILLPIDKDRVQGLTKNGGVAILCGDGDIDAGVFFRMNISHRPHGIRIFGGAPTIAPSFRGHDTPFIEGLLRNITWGMGAKKTRTIFLKPHWSCGVGKKFDYDMVSWLNLMPEVGQVIGRISNNVHSFFHVVKKTDTGEKQNSYHLIMPEGGIKL